MPDLFDQFKDLANRRTQPVSSGGVGNYSLPQVLPKTGYSADAGDAPIQDMPTRSKYDAGIMEGQNVDDYRESKQGAAALTGAFVGRVLGTGLTKLAQGFSIMGSAAGAGLLTMADNSLTHDYIKELTEGEDYTSLDRIIHNPVNKIFFDLEDKVKDLMPVYHSSDWGDKSVSNKFFHNFGEWMADQGADGIAFALSAIIPSGLVSKLGTGAAILGDASRGLTGLGEMFAAAGATEKGLAAGAKAIDWASQYGIQTSSEALFEAKDTGEQMMNKYLQQVNANRPSYAQYKTINDLPQNLQDDIKDKAAGAMKNDYWWNMIALAPSQIFEMGLINKFVGKAESTAIKGIGAEINAGENIAEDAVKATAKEFEGIGSGKFKKLSKSLYDASKAVGSTRAGAALKVIPEAIASEGLYEENIQNQIQDMSMQYGLQGKSGYFLDSGFNAAKQAVEAITPSHLNDPKYKDTRESIFAGAVIGALFGGAAGATSEFNFEKNEHHEREHAKQQAVDFLNSAKSDFLKQDLYVTKDVTLPDGSVKKQVQFDENNQPIINKPALANFLGNQKRMSDLVATEEYYTVAGQKEMANVVRDERTTNWALSHLQSGQADAMFAKLDNLAQAKPEDLQKLGFDPSFYGEDGKSVPVIQRVEAIRKKAAEVKTHYDEAIRSIPIEQTGRIEELTRLKSRIDSMNNQVDTLTGQRDQASLEYNNDPDHVKQIDQEARKLRALEDNKSYLDNRKQQLESESFLHDEDIKNIDKSKASDELRESISRIKEAHGVDRSRIEAAQKFHDDAIAASKSKIDNLKTTHKEQLDAAGYNSEVGNYNYLKNAGGRNNAGRSQDIKDAENRIVQLNGAIDEHQHEYDKLKAPETGARHYKNRLNSSFNQQLVDQAREEHTNSQEEIPVSEFEPTPQPPAPAVNEAGEIVPVPQAPKEPETVRTDPTTLTQSMELPEGNSNQAETVKQMGTTGGRLDQTKITKFGVDNLGKTLKVVYEGNEGGVFGTIRQGKDGVPAFFQDNGKEIPLERLLGGAIKSITNVTRQQVVVSRTEAPKPQESKVVTKDKQKEFDDTMYNPSKPYLAVGLNSTTGVDNSNDETQERWFRTTENLNLNDGKYQLVTVTNKNQAAAKKLLGSDWSDRLLYDDNTIKTVLLKDGKPVKADQFGVQKPDGDIVFTSLALTPSKGKVGVVEYRNSTDLQQAGIKDYTHQNDKSARYVVTEQEVKDGTVDRLLAVHQAWRSEVLADPNTKVIDVTSKGSGIRVKGQLGAVQGRLSDGQTVDVKIAKGESISDPSGKSITVKPGLTYAEHKGMVVPLTGRNLTSQEQSTIKEVLKQWSRLASLGNINRYTIELSNAIDTKDKVKIADLRDKLIAAGETPITKSLSAEELQSLYDKGFALTNERNQFKQYLEDQIRFGTVDPNSIYIDKGSFVFGDKSLAQEDLWNDTNTAELDEFLKNKYLQVSSRALAKDQAFTEHYLEDGEIKDRKWKSYNDYLTSTEYPDETVRNESDIPLRTSLAPMGEAQFQSVNLRYNGITDAVQPARTDTQAYKKVADGTQAAEKQTKRTEMPFDKVLDTVHQFGDGQTMRVELRLRDRTKGQEPFFIDYTIVDGKPEFTQLIKRNGEVSNIEPKGQLSLIKDELSDSEVSTARPNDLEYEYMSVKPTPEQIEVPTESVEPAGYDDYQEALDNPNEAPTSLLDDVVNEISRNNDFVGTRGELEDFVNAIEAAGIKMTPAKIVESYINANPGAVAPKANTNPTPQIRRRTFRGMTADGRISKPIDLAKEMAWFKERFPNINISRVVGLINGKYWGLFDSAGGVLLSTDAVEGTAYHEAFHTASLLYHDEATRQAVYKEYKDRTGFKGSDAEVEEKLADEFRDFVLADGKYTFPDKQQSFFRKLWEAIKSFLGVGNQQNIEDIFKKINDGGYANMDIADKLGLQASAPKSADLAESFSHTHAILEDMTVSFFGHFFGDGSTIDNLFDIYAKGNQPVVISDIYNTMREEYLERADSPDAGIIAKFKNDGVWEQYVNLHKQELANLGLKLLDKNTTDNTASDDNSDTNLETDGQKDNAQLESHIEVSTKEGMPKIVKLFLSSLPELDYAKNTDGSFILENGQKVLEHVPSAYMTDKVANPEKLMNILGNQLAGMTDIGQMISKIKELSIDFPSLTGLISRMQIGDEILPTTATANQARFQTLFWQQFSKANHGYYMTYLRDDGTVNILDSTSETQQAVARETWRTNLISQLKTPDSVIQINKDNKIVIDKNKVQQLKSIEDTFKRAAKLGIEFTFPEKIKASPTMFKVFRENLDAIINTIVASNQPVTDLYSREGLNAQNRIRNIAELETITNPDSIERQHIGLDNKTLYSLTLNNSLSLGINELNNLEGEWSDAVHSSAYAQNSVILPKLVDGSGYQIGLAINEGVKRQTADGEETSKLTPADALANIINGVVNGYYSILRPGDKKLEYKLHFGEFVESKGLITRDGNYSAKVNKIFRGYLQDEFNRVMALKAGYGNNIQNFNKHALLKNGRLDLGIFNDILKDVPMPVINSAEDATKWIDDNKEVVDASVRKFLEATTNQYGANARKLSVFKETMNKVAKKGFVGSGEYMLNGIDDSVANTILGKEATNERYTKNDIHQFFRYITVNQLIGNIEQTKLTTGAIEFYKDPLKRFSALTGTKKMSRVDSDYQNWMDANMPKIGYINGKKVNLTQDNKLRLVTVKDLIATAPKEQLDNFREGLKANGLTKDEIAKIMSKFESVNEADAQSWMHLPAYRQLLHRTGDWTTAHEAAYTKAIKGQALSADEMFLFQPLKPQGYGPQQSAGIYSPIFIKTSIIPLIPSVIKGTDLEKMMNHMYNNDIDMISTESAIKVGGKVDINTGDFVPLYNNVNGVAQINDQQLTPDLISVLPAQYFGIQLDVAPVRKNTTTRGTQQEKLIMSNIVNLPEGKEILSQYKDTVSKLVALAKQDMFDRLGIKAKGLNYVIPDRTKLLDYLEAQSIARGVPTNTLIGLREALTNGSTLDAVVNKDRIDSILASIVTDGAIKGQRNGEQRIQVAVSGYGQRVFEGDKLQTSDKLAPYVYDPKGTKPMELMTSLPKALVPYVEKVGGLAKFNQMIANGEVDERILKGIGFRIPTQQLSSMVYYKVKEFLPYESGSVVVMPSVITTIAGSDFDIDKLTMYDKNYDINYGSISNDLRPTLRRQLTDEGLIDQFKTLYNSLPEAMDDSQISNLLNYLPYAPDSITDDEVGRMDKIISKLQRRFTSNPELKYVEPEGIDKRALENRLLEINERVLSHPNNFKNLIAPIGNEVLSGLAKDMVDLRNQSTIGTFNEFEVNEANPYRSAELMNMNYLLEQGQRFQAGKDLLGIAAKQNTHHVLSQLSELHLKPEVKVWFKETEGQPLRLDNVTDLSGKHQISDIISEFINGFVDIVKDQFTFDLNANKETINPFFYLTRIGVPIESVTSFLNQPVIRKYIAERSTQDSLISKGLPDTYRKSKFQTIEEIRKELVTIAKGEQSLFAKWKKFDGTMPHYYKSAEARDEVRATYNNFTKEQLDKMILNPNTPQNAYRQLQVLDQFLQYQEDGGQLTELMQLNSQDTDGIKKSLTRSYVEKSMYNEFVKGNTIFNNAESVVNDALIKPYFDIVMEGEGYFAPLFDSKSDKSNTLRHEVVHQIKNMTLDDATTTMKRFENHLVAHLLQNVVTENYSIPLSEEAIKDIITPKEDGTVDYTPSLLLGNESAVNSLIKLKKAQEFPNDFVDGMFGVKGTDRTQGNYIDTVRPFTKRINKQQADVLSGAATDLLNTNPVLAKRIFRTTLIQSGLNNSYMSFHNLLPAKWFHNFVSEVMNVYRTSDTPTQNVIDDFYRNNWKNNTLVPSVEGRSLKVQGDYAYMNINNSQYSSNLYIKNWSPPDGMSREDFRTKRSDESTRDEDRPKWQLNFYKHYDNDGDSIIFKRVNPLGQSERYQETAPSWKDKSVMNSNNNVEGEFVSSENYNAFTGYKLDLGTNDPDNIPVSGELRDRLSQAASVNLQSQSTVDEAIKVYQQKIVEGMSEEQAADRAEHEITCR